MDNSTNDPILQLITLLSSELRQEIVYNEDSTGFWLKAQSYIFDNSVVSIRENITALSEGVTSDRELYNYFSTFVFRVFSQPSTNAAIEQFRKGFDEVASDSFFRGGFSFTTKELTKIDILLLFITVHRNQIQIAFLEAENFAEEKRLQAQANRKGIKPR